MDKEFVALEVRTQKGEFRKLSSSTESLGSSSVCKSANHKFRPLQFIVSDLLLVAQ